MNRKKLIVTAIVLLLILLIGGMLAYFTDVDTAANNFTLGQVNITVNETFTAPTDLMPGEEWAKTASIRNDGHSPVYVFAEVTIPKAVVKVDDETTATSQEIFNYTFNSAWTQVGTTDTSNAAYNKYVLAYVNSTSPMAAVAAGADTATIFANDKVTLKNIVENATMLEDANYDSVQTDTYTIDIKGIGIQTTGLPTTATTPAAIYALAQ